MLLASVEMLRHLGYNEHAAVIQNAWLTTLEQGKRTADLVDDTVPLSTSEFTHAVIDNLGQAPQRLSPLPALVMR